MNREKVVEMIRWRRAEPRRVGVRPPSPLGLRAALGLEPVNPGSEP